nr:DUF885 family protein [Streptomyces sp. C8S0]
MVDHIFERYPQVGRRAGRHDFDGRLPAVLPDAPSDVDGLLTAVRTQLDTLPANADPEVRADLGTAMRVLSDERFRIAELGRPHRGPDLWLAEADVHGYLRGDYAPLDERVAALSRHLAQLPDFLAAAAKTFGGTLPAGERISGFENARAHAASVPKLAAQLVAARPDVADSSLLGLADSARAAFVDFADAVAATAPARAVFGPDRLAGYLEAAEGIETLVDELLAEAEDEVRQLVARLDALSARLGVGSREEAYALMRAQLPAGSVVTALSGIIERLREFWAEQDVVTLTSRYGFDIRLARDASTSAAVIFDHAGVLEAVPQPHVLYVPEPGDPAVLRDYLNEPMLEMIAVHEAVPGHYLHHEATPQHAGVIRRCLPWFAGTSEDGLTTPRSWRSNAALPRAARSSRSRPCATRWRPPPACWCSSPSIPDGGSSARPPPRPPRSARGRRSEPAARCWPWSRTRPVPCTRSANCTSGDGASWPVQAIPPRA